MFESAYTQKELQDIANNTDHDEFTTDLAVCLKDAYVEIERQRVQLKICIEALKFYAEVEESERATETIRNIGAVDV